ncbi:hypothetical protein, partial [Aeromonas allosaccharophila]
PDTLTQTTSGNQFTLADKEQTIHFLYLFQLVAAKDPVHEAIIWILGQQLFWFYYHSSLTITLPDCATS